MNNHAFPLFNKAFLYLSFNLELEMFICVYISDLRIIQNRSVPTIVVIMLESTITNISHRCILFGIDNLPYRFIFICDLYPFCPSVCNTLYYSFKNYVTTSHVLVAFPHRSHKKPTDFHQMLGLILISILNC